MRKYKAVAANSYDPVSCHSFRRGTAGEDQEYWEMCSRTDGFFGVTAGKRMGPWEDEKRQRWKDGKTERRKGASMSGLEVQ